MTPDDGELVVWGSGEAEEGEVDAGALEGRQALAEIAGGDGDGEGVGGLIGDGAVNRVGGRSRALRGRGRGPAGGAGT